MELIQIETKSNDLSKVEHLQIDLNVNDPGIKIWLIDPTYTQQQISSESMPAAIGGIATFTEKNLKLKNPIRLFKYPEKLAMALKTDCMAVAVAGFSTMSRLSGAVPVKVPISWFNRPRP